ncbi:MAG: PLP-dependent aminotransferase family protein, partial [Mycobacterium sp.]|nr:PLP-dependent aminotransferase family protein [Mycobacterium sp.]
MEPFKQTNFGDVGFPLDLPLALDRSGRRGLREQLQQQLRSAIQQGKLPAGTLLPASRTLASDLGVARSVVVDAYEHLIADGYLGGRQGSGTRVLATAQPPTAAPSATPDTVNDVRFVGGLPDPALFPRVEWLRHYRTAVHDVPNHQLNYPDPLGALALRQALANYLCRVRGVVAETDRMMITAGLTQALVLV